MKSTDKLYEISKDAALKAQSSIYDALSESGENHHMTVEDVNALGRILAYRMDKGDDNGMYEHVVDFLWMSFHIEINTKMLLLGLIED